ncbi:hypothetical protein BDP27DRAFT_1150815, partial [Rhodocollybia butyracea]
RVSILPALTINGIISYDIVPGSVNGEKFHQIPYTTPYPGPRSVIVMDNCNIHHGDEVRELIEDRACMFY